MEENNMLSASLIIKKLKSILKVKTDIQLSDFLKVRANTISTWKKRNSVDYPAIISVCDLYGINLNEIFLSQKNQTKSEGSSTETLLVTRENQFQYCIDNSKLIETLPKYNFPFINVSNSRAFQVLSNNMFPVIEENSFVICEETSISNIPNNSLVVIVSHSKGLFVNRISKIPEKPNNFLLISENTFFSPIVFSEDDINEIWLIKACLSYNMTSDNKFTFINDSFQKINMALAKNLDGIN